MGCCGSKESHDKDDVHTPLINKPSTDSGSPPTIDVKKEQEFWKRVIERTTENLIDISSAPNEPLQHQDIQARTEKYQALVRQVTWNPMELSSIHTFPDDDDNNEDEWNVPDYPPWLDQAILNVDRAMAHIKIQPKGDFVIPLGPPKSLHYS